MPSEVEMDSKADLNESYFEEYRRKRGEIRILHEESRELKERLESTQKMISKLGEEVNGMRQVITKMIDEGIDPVQAKLQHDGDHQSDLWTYDHINHNSGKLLLTSNGNGGPTWVSIKDVI